MRKRQRLDAVRARAAGSSRAHAAAGTPPALPVPADAVDSLLMQLLQVRHESGALQPELEVFGLKRPMVLDELVVIATSPPPSRADGGPAPVLTKEGCPLLFRELRDRLFVGFSHNLFLESLVSRLAMLERRHPKTHAMMLDLLFKYHMRHADAREERLKGELRSGQGGGLRKLSLEKLAEKKALHGCNRTLAQQLALARDAIGCAEQYSPEAAPELLLQRKLRGVKRGVLQLYASYNQAKDEVAQVKVESLRSTCEAGPVRARKAALTLQACRTLVAPQAAANTKVAKTRGNIFKDAEGMRARKARMRERLQEAKNRSAASRRGRRLSEKQLRQAEAREARKRAPAPLRNANGAVRKPRASAAELEQRRSRTARGTGTARAAAASVARPQPEPEGDSSAGEGEEAGPDPAAPVQMLHRQAAALALRLSRANAEAYAAAKQVAEEAQAAADGQVKRAQELAAAAERQKIESEAAVNEHATLRKALKVFQENFKKVKGRDPKKGDQLSYEYRKALERYKELKAKFPGLGGSA